MKYFAIQLGSDGGMRYMPKTSEPRTVEIGAHQDKQTAVDAACQKLDCRQIFRGVLGRTNGLGGYMVLNEQEFAEV